LSQRRIHSLQRADGTLRDQNRDGIDRPERRYPNGVDPRAILALAPGVPVALVGWIVPGLEFLFDARGSPPRSSRSSPGTR
jgi:hypothetical protein